MRKIIVVAAILLICCAGGAGEVKRVAYLEPGPFWLFSHTMRAFKEEMAKQNEFEVVFPPELRVSLDWTSDQKAMDDAVDLLMRRDDIDLIIAGGTAACRTLIRRNNGRTPFMGIGLADPVLSGVVRSPEDSGVDNFTCEVIVDRWKQMLRVFHDVVRFSKLGVLYSNVAEGKLYSGLADALAVAEELGFSVLAREIPDEGTGSCSDGLKWLHENGADAFFIGPLNCFDWESADPSPLFRQLNMMYQMPTFARDGSFFVQGGALMGFATWDFPRTARRYAEKALAIFRGAKPRSLPMIARMEPLIAVNLQTAREIGFDLPFDVLIAADEIYVATSVPDIEQFPSRAVSSYPSRRPPVYDSGGVRAAAGGKPAVESFP